MAALSGERNTREVYCNAMSIHRVKSLSNQKVYCGAIVAQNASGALVPASDSAGLTVLGRCDAFLGGGKAICKSGVFIYANGTGTEKLTVADLNKKVYVLDDQTVGKSGGTNKIVCGTLRDLISETEVAVEIGNQTL